MLFARNEVRYINLSFEWKMCKRDTAKDIGTGPELEFLTLGENTNV